MRTMRRMDKELTRDIAEAILKQNDYGILSLILPEGTPYGVPVNYGFFDNKIIIHAAMEGTKIDAIKAHPEACFTVVHAHIVDKADLSTFYASAMAFGTVLLIENPIEKRKILLQMLSHYKITESMAQVSLDTETNHTAVLVLPIRFLSAKGDPRAVIIANPSVPK